MIRRKQMLIFWKIPVITKQCFQNIERTFHEFLFQKYFKDIPGILIGYKKSFMKSKTSKNCFLSYPVKFLILVDNLLSGNVFLNFMETVFHSE